jgi:hypothetical protein
VVFHVKLQKEQIDHRRWPVGREALQLGREKGHSYLSVRPWSRRHRQDFIRDHHRHVAIPIEERLTDGIALIVDTPPANCTLIQSTFGIG